MPKVQRGEKPDAYAPDGAEIRALIDRPQGATRLSVAEALVPVGERKAKVYHQTIYEEVWYITAGMGSMHLQSPDVAAEEVFDLTPGDAVLILPGHGFRVRNTGTSRWSFSASARRPGQVARRRSPGQRGKLADRGYEQLDPPHIFPPIRALHS